MLFMVVYRMFGGYKGSWDTNEWLLKTMSIRENMEDNSYLDRQSRGERACREAIENLTGKKFPKARPDFLRNYITGNKSNLELDCYNSKMKLAVEYNGRQHYEYIPFFHKSKEAFYNQKYRDDMKKRLCSENGVTLIVVPYTIPPKNILPYIAHRMQREYTKVDKKR